MAEPAPPASERLRPPDRLWRRRVASFGHAFRGVWAALRSEVHLQFHALATVVVIGLGFYYALTRLEWALVTLAIAGVWAAELVNTAIEALTDLASPDYHPLAGKAKDVAAGAVLLAALGAVIVGALVFGPKIFKP
ncbi:diacylglycerol kinase family protein [Hymenobacter sp. BT770]|uniref:diacylglycerol kinase family protein n=1 Tax=Hymenobacter sp. BT770 TaxID=2886942 RepID=UPI001D12F403|nr:diacylglycerol kinase family protein [Hymenobacter sp. BT770]MCC3153468.1 diacylglycerol kinase family protein [Hymenobacter sp. BT770]MDO3415450.1 diacylglycerol kinase family protein [Hymenobacter sp. BT770]